MKTKKDLIEHIIRNIVAYKRGDIAGRELLLSEYTRGLNDGLEKALETIIFSLPSKEFELYKKYLRAYRE